VLAIGVLLASSSLYAAATGPFDPGFGTNGRTTLAVLGSGWQPRHLHRMRAAPAGGYLLAGAVGAPGVVRNAPAVVRVTDAGVPDAAYGDQGLFVHNSGVGTIQASVEAHDATVLADGSVILVGAARAAADPRYWAPCIYVARVAPNGVLDAQYGPGPGPACISMGYASSALVVFPAPYVANDGTFTYVGATLTFDSGSPPRMVRLDAQGRLDPAFASQGVYLFDPWSFGYGRVARAEADAMGRVALGGFYGPSHVAAMTANLSGQFNGFVPFSYVTLPRLGLDSFARDLALAVDGSRLLVTGHTLGFVTIPGLHVQRVDPFGSVDMSWSSSGTPGVLTVQSAAAPNAEPEAIAAREDLGFWAVGADLPQSQPTGQNLRVVVAARFRDGSADTGIGPDGALVVPMGSSTPSDEREVDAVSEAPLRLTVAARTDQGTSGYAFAMFRVRIDRVYQDGFE
jgi:hypothetical protein